ncbi:ankyrin repeat family protein [Plakobranchus ocellatus]|uniref:Ankyrin repeat family protein n=1 Tax=Plakobranchus ocellatus TaxID=259542 RepID=A0AAV3ZP08_9GAST|nr:ankyrin repeat family protein [Plakobranchus ocellatus]
MKARNLGGQTALYLAVERGNSEVIRQLIADGSQLEARNIHGNTALHLAVSGDDSETVSKLIAAGAGAQMKARNLGGQTALHLAVKRGNSEIVNKLLGAGAQMMQNNGGNTALHLAAERGNSEVVNKLLAAGAQMVQNNKGNTALHLAAERGNSEVVNKLLAAGAQMVLNNYGYTALHLAAERGNSEVVSNFIVVGAQLEARNNQRNTPFCVAIRGDNSEIVNQRISAGFELEAPNNRGDTALHLAVRKGHNDIVNQLISAEVELEVLNNEGDTALHIAIEECNIKLVDMMITAGAQLEAPNIDGDTALHLAVKGGTDGIIGKLIEAGAQLDVRNYDGLTPLLSLLGGRNYDGLSPLLLYRDIEYSVITTISLLKEAGADLTAVDMDGNTALHLMLQPRLTVEEKTLRLLACDGVINRQTKYEQTPLMLAAENFDYKAIKVLLELGADPNIVNNTSTPLSFVLMDRGEKFRDEAFDCAEQLINHNALTSLPRSYSYFHRMIIKDERQLLQAMVTHGMPPLYETVENLDYIVSPEMKVYFELDKFSPLAVALLCNNTTIAQYMLENCFLTPADVVGSSKLQDLRSLLERSFRGRRSLRFMEENLAQPMSLFQLSFVAVSAQLGGMAGREERVSKTPLPQIIQDMLLFRNATFLCENSGSLAESLTELFSNSSGLSNQLFSESDSDF